MTWSNVGNLKGPKGDSGEKGVLLVKAADEAEAITASASNPGALYYWEES